MSKPTVQPRGQSASAMPKRCAAPAGILSRGLTSACRRSRHALTGLLPAKSDAAIQVDRWGDSTKNNRRPAPVCSAVPPMAHAYLTGREPVLHSAKGEET